MMRLIAAIGAIVTALLFDTTPPATPAPTDPPADDGFESVKGKLADLIDARIAEKMPGVIDSAFERWLQPAGGKHEEKPAEPAPAPASAPGAPAPEEKPASSPSRFLETIFGSRS